MNGLKELARQICNAWYVRRSKRLAVFVTFNIGWTALVAVLIATGWPFSPPPVGAAVWAVVCLFIGARMAAVWRALGGVVHWQPVAMFTCPEDGCGYLYGHCEADRTERAGRKHLASTHRIELSGDPLEWGYYINGHRTSRNRPGPPA